MSYTLGLPVDKIILSYGNKINKKNRYGLLNKYIKYINRRSKKEPYAYIVKSKEFYSIGFFVNKNVLIPRPDTETLVSEGLKEIKRLSGSKLKDKINIIDLGTGSGAIAISLAKNAENVLIYAADNSYKVLKVTQKNIILNNVEKNVILTYFDILNPNICWYNEDSFDIIIANPPYIRTGELETLDEGVRLYEPLKALDGGVDGLKFYRKIFEFVKSLNGKSGNFCLLLEIDSRYMKDIKDMYELEFKNKENKQIYFIKDLSGKERVVKIVYG
jgi:release factor glutamine methyltransferase